MEIILHKSFFGMNRLAKMGAEALKPRKKGIKWYAPLVSRRKANVLRKRALLDGSFGSVVEDPGERYSVDGLCEKSTLIFEYAPRREYDFS